MFQIEILAEVDEFMAGERSDHDRRLAADDLRQAIEEVYQPIEQAIAKTAALACIKVASGIASFHIDALYSYTYSDAQRQTFRALDQVRIPGLPGNRRVEWLAYLRDSSRIPHGSKRYLDRLMGAQQSHDNPL